jgi:hypothetical protein
LLLNLLGDTMTAKHFTNLMLTSSKFHAYRHKEGRAIIFEGHTNSFTAGLASHAREVRDHHQEKPSNANLMRWTTSCNAGSSAANAQIYRSEVK